MKPEIHPSLNKIKVHCGCGNEFETLSVVSEMRVEICGACHPFYTGTKRAVAATGRVQRFEDKYKNAPATPAAKKAKTAGKKR